MVQSWANAKPIVSVNKPTQNAPKCTILEEKSKQNSGEGHSPLPRPNPFSGLRPLDEDDLLLRLFGPAVKRSIRFT